MTIFRNLTNLLRYAATLGLIIITTAAACTDTAKNPDVIAFSTQTPSQKQAPTPTPYPQSPPPISPLQQDQPPSPTAQPLPTPKPPTKTPRPFSIFIPPSTLEAQPDPAKTNTATTVPSPSHIIPTTPKPPAAASNLQSIEITPPYISISPPPGTVQLTLTGRTSDNSTRPLTAAEQERTIWETPTNQSIIVSSSGLVTARAEGETVVKARLDGMTTAAITSAWQPLKQLRQTQGENRLTGIIPEPRMITDIQPGDTEQLNIMGYHGDGTRSQLPPEIVQRLRFWSSNPRTVSVNHQGQAAPYMRGGADIHVSVLGTRMSSEIPVIVWGDFTPLPPIDGYCSIDLHQDNTWVNAHRIHVTLDKEKQERQRAALLQESRSLAQKLGAQPVFILRFLGEITLETPCPQGDQEERLHHLDKIIAIAQDHPGVVNAATTPALPHDGIGRPTKAINTQPPTPAPVPPEQPTKVYLSPRTDVLRLHPGDTVQMHPRAILSDGSDVALPLDDRKEVFFESGPGMWVDENGILQVNDDAETDNSYIFIDYRGRSHRQDTATRPRATDSLHVTEDCHTTTPDGDRIKLDLIAATQSHRTDKGHTIAEDIEAQYVGKLDHHDPYDRHSLSHLFQLPCGTDEDFHKNIEKVRRHSDIASAWPHTAPQDNLQIYAFRTIADQNYSIYPGQEVPITLNLALTDMSQRYRTLADLDEWRSWSDNQDVAIITDEGNLKAISPGTANIYINKSDVTRSLDMEVIHTPIDSSCRALVETRTTDDQALFHYTHLDQIRFTMKRNTNPQHAEEAAAQVQSHTGMPPTITKLTKSLPGQPAYLLHLPCSPNAESPLSYQQFDSFAQAFKTLRDNPNVHSAEDIRGVITVQLGQDGEPVSNPYTIPRDPPATSPYKRQPQGDPIAIIAYPLSGYPGDTPEKSAIRLYQNGAIENIPSHQVKFEELGPSSWKNQDGDIVLLTPGISIATVEHQGLTTKTAIITHKPIARYPEANLDCLETAVPDKLGRLPNQVVIGTHKSNHDLEEVLQDTGGKIIAVSPDHSPRRERGQWVLVEYPCDHTGTTAIEKHEQLSSLKRGYLALHTHTVQMAGSAVIIR